MSRFYYPNGEEFKSINEFIQYYNNSYYLQNNRTIKRVPRNSEYVEKEIEYILENGIKTKEDITKIIAWKIGRIDHCNSEKKQCFIYYKNKPNVNRYNRPVPLRPLFEYILNDIGTLEKQANDYPQEVLEKLLAFNGIGSVYAITILYFLSRKMYPIYDQFAHIAIKVIDEENSFNSLITDADLKREFNPDSRNATKIFENYNEYYIKRLQSIFGNAYKTNRDIDRALWVYGHLFKDTKTNQKRIKQVLN